jgi:hypothetical protein
MDLFVMLMTNVWGKGLLRETLTDTKEMGLSAVNWVVKYALPPGVILHMIILKKAIFPYF